MWANGIAKADREVRKSDSLLKRNFWAGQSTGKCITDITKVKMKYGKLYVSASFDCFDLTVLGLVMDDNMRAELCVRTLDSAAASYPALRGAIVHSDQGSQYTSRAYRAAVETKRQRLIRFMKRLIRASKQKVFLILDNLKVHHGKFAAAC